MKRRSFLSAIAAGFASIGFARKALPAPVPEVFQVASTLPLLLVPVGTIEVRLPSAALNPGQVIYLRAGETIKIGSAVYQKDGIAYAKAHDVLKV